MLRDPLSVQKCFADHFCSQKPNFAKTRKKNLEPLDLLATVGQPRVCVNVSECVRVCGEERRCGVVALKSTKKTHFLSLQTLLSLSLTNKLSLYLSLSQS